MAAEKNTVRTTVTLEADLKKWLDDGATRNRREFSAHLNAVLEEARADDERAGDKRGTNYASLRRGQRAPRGALRSTP